MNNASVPVVEFERILYSGGDIGAGDALALYEMPETVQEAFAYGWNRCRVVSEQLRGWVSVNDRLPDESTGTVAVLCDDGAILTGWATYWHGARTDFACWTFPHDDDADSVVTHWMLLTEPMQTETETETESVSS